MTAPLNGLLRAGFALKLDQIKRATRSYLRDRTSQATDTATSYAVAAGLFVAAGIFLIAACLVGLAALFRWIEIKYGLFQAFGAIGALLLVIAALCAGLAVRNFKRRTPHFPSLTSRLRVAVKANPVNPGPIDATTAAAVLAAPTGMARVDRRPRRTQVWRNRDNRNMGAGLILAATLLGWAAVRRRQRARSIAA